MYTDTIVEFFVERKKGKKTIIKYVAIGVLLTLFLVVLLSAALMDDGTFFPVLLILAIAGVGLAYYFVNRQNVESEYSFFSGELTIDRIINKKKRIKMVEFKLKDVDEMGLYKAGETDLPEAAINFTSNENADGGIYLRVPSSLLRTGKRVGVGPNNTYIIVENDEKVKSAMKPFIRASIYREAMKNIG